MIWQEKSDVGGMHARLVMNVNTSHVTTVGNLGSQSGYVDAPFVIVQILGTGQLNISGGYI